MQNSYWCLEGDNEKFKFLYDIQAHLHFNYTPAERLSILHGKRLNLVVDDEICYTMIVYVDRDGFLFFSRMWKI